MSNQNRSNKSCAFCHEPGHHIKHCGVLANTRCNNCSGLGHTTKRCKKSGMSRKRVPQNKPYRRRVDRRKVVANQNGWSSIGPVKVAEPEKWPILKSRSAKPVKTKEIIATKKPKKECGLPMFKRHFKKGERWADICDMEDELNCPEEIEQHMLVLKNNIRMMKKY